MRMLCRTIVVIAVVLALGCGPPPWNEANTETGWTRSLRSALAGTTKVRVRRGDARYRAPESDTLFETTDLSKIAELIELIEVYDRTTGDDYCEVCDGGGNPTLEFYRKQRLVVSLGLSPGRGLFWPKGKWVGDAAFTEQSGTALLDWLAANGVTEPRDRVNAGKRYQLAEQARLNRIAAVVPEPLKEDFAEDRYVDRQRFADSLESACGSVEKEIGVLFDMLGATNDSWTTLKMGDMLAEDLLSEFDLATVQSAARAALMSGDRQRRRGAARFWVGWKTVLTDWQPADMAQLHSIVLDVQQEAACYESRLDAMSNLCEWAHEFPEEEVDRRLSAGLHDPHVRVRRQAMLVASRMDKQQVVPHLLAVVQGSPVETMPLPQIPEEEQLCGWDGHDTVAAMSSEAEVAALALGYLRHTPAVPIIESLPPSPMNDVALALLGKMNRLKQDYFRPFLTDEMERSLAGASDFERRLHAHNTELQLGAVEAVVRVRGRTGLAWAFLYKQASRWWEEDYVLDQLKKMLLENQAPGSEIIRSASSLEDLTNWYLDHGAAYLRQVSDTAP